MNTVTFAWTGLEELRAALRSLPDDLTGDARAIVLAHGDRAVSAIVAGYPEKTGTLKGRVVAKTLPGTGRFYAGVQVRSQAPHATIYEKGTTDRSYRGADRGVMPPAPPGRGARAKIITERRGMWIDLIGVLQRAGLIVTGDGS